MLRAEAWVTRAWMQRQYFSVEQMIADSFYDRRGQRLADYGAIANKLQTRSSSESGEVTGGAINRK